MKFEIVIWDWNGTLLSDVSANIATINALLTRRSLPPIGSTDAYLKGFNIPVKDYYVELGFDVKKESFDDIAAEYIDEYKKRLPRCTLFDGTRETLQTLHDAGVKQYIVSAAEDSRLKAEVASYGIAEFFHGIFGNSNNLGGGKAAVAEKLIDTCGVNREKVLFIGDLTHDAEVAESVGCACALIPMGHQSRERLSATGATVIEGITRVPRYVTGI